MNWGELSRVSSWKVQLQDKLTLICLYCLGEWNRIEKAKRENKNNFVVDQEVWFYSCSDADFFKWPEEKITYSLDAALHSHRIRVILLPCCRTVTSSLFGKLSRILSWKGKARLFLLLEKKRVEMRAEVEPWGALCYPDGPCLLLTRIQGGRASETVPGSHFPHVLIGVVCSGKHTYKQVNFVL